MLKTNTVATDSRLMARNATEAAALIDRALKSGNSARLDDKLWHHVRGVLMVSADCLRELASHSEGEACD